MHGQDPTLTGNVLEEDLTKWKNLNSFVVRLIKTGSLPWSSYPIWQLRTALEEPFLTASGMHCRLWVASEWVMHCAKPIFQEMGSKTKLPYPLSRSLGTGSLCNDGISPMSVERWTFWKERFAELAANADSLGLHNTITARILEAPKTMAAVEEQDQSMARMSYQ